jgi:hypothetical protein
LNDIGSEDAATKWAHRRLPEKNKLNAADAKHIEEAFRAKLFSFAIHHGQGAPQAKNGEWTSVAADAHKRKGKSTGQSPSVDKSVLTHPQPRRVRDREHVRFVAQQSCLVCGRSALRCASFALCAKPGSRPQSQ